MATAAFAFWSLETLKAHIGATTSGKDTLLERIANGVSLMFERTCRRQFVIREVIELADGPGCGALYLRHYPVVAVSLLRIYRYPSQTTPDTVTIGAGYSRLVADRGELLLHNDVFTRGRANVELTYTAGYFAQDAGATSEAAQVYQTGLDLCQLLFQEQATGGLGMSNLTIGPMGFAIKPEWPKHIHQAFRDWKRVRL
jgi:hypothetical protein